MLSTILLLLYILQCVSYRMKPLMASQVHAISVPNECMKIRLDSYLSEQFSSIYTRSFLAQLCENNNVKVNNIVQSKSYTVKGGEKIEVIVDKPDSCVNPENITLEILYEDNDMIAVNKPSGMVVHPAVGSPNGTFVNALLNYLGPNATRLYPPSNIAEYNLLDKYDGSSSLRQRLGVVHRLDKGTSGVLLAGKSFSAVGKLANLFKEREVQKVYLAVCVGNPGDATIDLPIGRSEVNKQQMCIYDGPPGKPAVSHIKTLAFDGKLSVCLVHIETGRTHQIRVHLQSRRTPVLGDDVYGSKIWNKYYRKTHQIRRPLLHSYKTQLINPFSEENIEIRAPIPYDLSEMIQKISRINKESIKAMSIEMEE